MDADSSRGGSLDDRLARERQQIEDECELRIEGAIAKGLAEHKRKMEEDVLDLKEARQAAETARQEVTDLLSAWCAR